MSKVVHLSPEAHNKAKAYCKENNLHMSKWIGQLVLIAVNSKPVDVIPVARKDNTKYDTSVEEEVWSRPAFWSK